MDALNAVVNTLKQRSRNQSGEAKQLAAQYVESL